MSNELSPQQQAVVACDDSAFVVKASAGSGKTRVLVERYLRAVVDDGLSPDQILTVTFTRKAAAEMKRRIVNGLRTAGRNEDAQSAETGPIQTLHGFCERLLRENAIEAGVDPDFTIADGAVARTTLEEAIANEIARTPKSDTDSLQLIGLLAGKKQFGTRLEHGQLKSAVRLVVDQLRGTLASAEDLSRFKDATAFMQAGRKLALDALAQAGAIFSPPDVTSDEFWKLLREALRAGKSPIPSWFPRDSQISGNEEMEGSSLSVGLMRLAARAWKAYEEELFRRQMFDFAMLERFAVELLKEKCTICDRISSTYRMLLIDESQDLNPIQHQMVDLLAIGNQMFVGDSKQSIFGWRQADVRIFDKKTEALPTFDLPRNYRSDPAILHVVDAIFSKLWNHYLPMAEGNAISTKIDSVELWSMRQLDSVAVADWIADICETESPGDIAVLVRATRAIAPIANRLDEAGIPVRIVGGKGQYFANQEVDDIANILEALCNPNDDFRLLSALRGPAGGLSLDSIASLAAHKNVYHGLREPDVLHEKDLARAKQFLAWFDCLSLKIDRLAAWEALSCIVADSGIFESIASTPNSRQVIANIRKLIAIAAEQPGMSAREFAESIRSIQILDHNESDAGAIDDAEPAITFMTIHRSKGLEFPIVVLPDNYGPLSKTVRQIEIDKDRALVGFGLDNTKNIVRDLIAAERRAAEREEAERLLYVAMTRAQRKLCVAIDPFPGTSNYAQLINSKLKEAGIEGLTVRESNSELRPEPEEQEWL